MKKMFMVIWVLFCALAVTANAFGQTGEEAQMAGNLLANLNTYRMNPAQVNQDVNVTQDFLDQVNQDNDIYENSPINKMSVGVINTTTAWTEIPKRVSSLSEKANPLVGMTVGFAEGLASGIRQGASGVIDLATFGLPPYDEPLMQPKYKAKDPNRGYQVDLMQW